MKIYSRIAGAMALALTFLCVSTPAFAADGLGTVFDASAGLSLTGLMGMALAGAIGSVSTKTASELATEAKAEFSKQLSDVQEKAEKALAEAEKGVKLSAEDKEAIDTALTEFNGTKARLEDLEQKLARDTGRGDDRMTAGERFVANDEFKAFAGQSRPKGRVTVDVKDITSLTTDAAGSVGALVPDQRVQRVDLPQRRMTIRALLASGSMNGASIEYERETGFTNNATPVAEGAPKPQSEIQYELETATARTIAHWMRASVQILDDAPALQSIIDQRLRYGLAYVEETQLLNGSGTGQNLEGLVTAATDFAAPGGLVADQLIDTIRLGILQVSLAEFPANGIVLNPIDWAFIEMLKDTQGRYLIGNPQGSLNAQLWNLPVVPTQAMTEDKFLVGAFDLAAQLFDRQNATVEVSTEDGDNFKENMVTIRAEERVALAIYRPEALVYGDLGRVD